MYSTDVTKATELAQKLHSDQVDKSGQPYIGHLTRVAGQLNTPEEEVVGLLHDSLEDQSARLEQFALEETGKTMSAVEYLALLFGDDTARAIQLVTHMPGDSYDDYVRKAATNPISKAVKLSDLIDNSNLGRLPVVTLRDAKRQEKYNKYIQYLLSLDE